MGKCNECGKKILYNKYVMYKGRVLCMPCNIARLLKETLDKEKAKQECAMRKLAKPSKKAKKAMKEEGITGDGNFIPSDLDGHALDVDDMKEKEDDKNEDSN